MPQPGAFDLSEATPAPSGEILPEPLPPEPFGLLTAWYDEAHRRKVSPCPNAMTLATVGERGRPAARIVLCKDIDPAAGSLTFFTNYQSRKAQELDSNPRAALVMFWDALDRQVRIEGSITRVAPEVSDAYFATRPWESRVGAWSSDQSKPIGSRADLLAKVEQSMRRFGIDPAHPADQPIPRPPHWGGYYLTADFVELWVSGKGRIHDRAAWTRERAGTPWRSTRVQP